MGVGHNLKENQSQNLDEIHIYSTFDWKIGRKGNRIDIHNIQGNLLTKNKLTLYYSLGAFITGSQGKL